MPNHIQNRLHIIGATPEVQKLLKAICTTSEKGGHIAMDFNKILPMPEELGETTSDGWVMPLENKFSSQTKLKEHMEELRQWTLRCPDQAEETINNFLQAIRNYMKYGHATWYNWAVEHWGTKWNAYSQPDERNTEDTIFFQTAWAAPIDLMKRLSGLFPKVTLAFTYADEDSGSNTGNITIQDGKVMQMNQPQSQSKEGYDIYFELNPGTRENYEFINGKYQYKDQ